jgi:hypothetical protein
MLALSLALFVFGRYVAKDRRLVKDQVEADAIESAMRHSPSFVLYGVGIGVSLVLPTAGIALYLASAITRAVSARRVIPLHRPR